MIDEYIFLKKKEFKELSEKDKWIYVKSLKKLIKSLAIQAEKNCEECEKNLIDSNDVNIDLFFEDWRVCKNNCEECGKEEQVQMCELQHNILNHFANELGNIRNRINSIVKLILRKDTSGSKILKKLNRATENNERKKRELGDMFA